MDFHEDFEKIRADRLKVVNSDVYPGLKNLVSQIYPDEAHFIYELLQNAEDVGATEVHFIVMKSMLVFEHNGTKMFDADDIRAITNIAASTKLDNYVQAGKFGIGFKSVYAFTNTPSIYCDTVNFEIQDLLLPSEIAPKASRQDGWTVFQFPFINKIKEKSKKVITQGLQEIESTSLLFLINITSIKYKLEDKKECLVKKNVQGNVVTSSIYEGKTIKKTSCWKRFSRQTALYGKKVNVDVAFEMEKKENGGYRFIPGQDKVCITFLAKNEKSNLKFYINAPFGCPPTRDTVNKEDDDNKKLCLEIAKLFKEVLDELKLNKKLTEDFFDILPIDDDEIPVFYQPLVMAIRELFINKNYLPTVDNSYVRACNGILSTRSVINRIFTIADMQQLFDNKRLQFVKNRPLNTRGYRFLKELDILELTPITVLNQMCKMDEASLIKWLKRFDEKHLADVYAFLHKGVLDLSHDLEKFEDYAEYINHNTFPEDQEEVLLVKKYADAAKRISAITELKLVKGNDGKFYKASDIRIPLNGVTIPKDIVIVDKKLISKKDSLGFLKHIGVKEFDEKELGVYLSDKDVGAFLKKMEKLPDKPLSVARNIMDFLSQHDMDEVDLSKYKFVATDLFMGSGRDRRRVLLRPDECFIDAPLYATGLSAAKDIHGKKEISTIYKRLQPEEQERWVEILKYYGAFCSFKIEEENIDTGYPTGYHYNYVVKDLKKYIEKKNPVLNRFIWNEFNKPGMWHEHYAVETIKINQKYPEEIKDSSVVHLLKNMPWILDKDNTFRIPQAISDANMSKDWIRYDENPFLEAINFGDDKKKKDEDKRKKEELRRLKQEKQLEAAKCLGFDDAEAVMMAKENSLIISELADLGINIQEILASKRKEKNRKKYTISEQLKSLKKNKFVAKEIFDDGKVYAVKNPDRRSSKLEEEMASDIENDTKSVIIKRSAVNSAEKHFVGSEYSGRCQICDKTIFKKDGSRYFTAINLLDTGHLQEEYLKGLATGWNTLCLCPNCAAEFKYGAVSINNLVSEVKKIKADPNYFDYYTFDIEMQGEKRTLRYTPKHLLALQTALKFFSKNKNIDTIDE